jgi:NAD(P)-dependent dehydrogenase (short-subunit alcohol dehydrogenase family)
MVLTALVAAFDSQIGQTSYTAAKAGVHGMTLVAARDLASWQIHVNTIAPGIFDTPMFAQLRQDIRVDGSIRMAERAAFTRHRRRGAGSGEPEVGRLLAGRQAPVAGRVADSRS